MSTEFFHVQEHIIPTQYIREYPGATAQTQEEVLQLHVKQYTPMISTPLPSDAITIIGAHANGFPKELYEPLWEEIYHRSKIHGFAIRSIWIADVAHQGLSSVANEDKLGNDPSWFDHSRDLLHMINHFRNQMHRPLVGIGHSMGGAQLVDLSLIHPRLFTTLILFDPVLQIMHAMGPPGERVSAAMASTHRRDWWPSRRHAAEVFAKSPFYQAWDKRVFRLWLQYGLRDLPTAIYPEPLDENKEGPPVTLTTTKHQEVWTFLRPNYLGRNAEGKPVIDRRSTPDITPDAPGVYPFYRPEPIILFQKLPHLRPPVLYIYGSKSNLSKKEFRDTKHATTGTGVGGSGGAREGRVKSILFEGVGHLIPMEVVNESAEECAKWLEQAMEQYREEEASWQELRAKREKMDDMMVDKEWKQYMGPFPRKEKLVVKTKI